MSPPKSKVWSYFSRKENGIAQCKLCLQQIKVSGNTSNMLKHLKLHHVQQFNTIVGLKKSSSGSSKCDLESKVSTANSRQNDSTPSTSCTPQAPTPKSSISNTANDPHSDSASHSTGRIQDCFRSIANLKEGGYKHAAITNAILYFICKDNRPFYTVCGDGFKRMMKEAIPGYKIPSDKTFKKLLDEKYEALHDTYIQKFQSISNFSITCDVWSESMTMKSYLGVTIHYVQRTSFESAILAVKELSDRHTAIYLGTQLRSILEEWNIPLGKVVAVVTDNGANMVAALNQIEDLGKGKHIPCFAHTLNLVAEAVIQNNSIAPIISKVREVVKWVKSSVIVSDQMRDMQRNAGIAEGNIKKFVLDVKTRWNSVFYMLERYLELQELVNPILLKTQKSPEVLTALDTDMIKNFISLLQPLEFMTRECCAEKYITISKIIPLIFCSMQQISAVNAEIPAIETCKVALVLEMTRRFGKIELCTPVALATLLDPRFKNINFQNASACGTAIQKLKKLIDVERSPSSREESDSRPVENEKHNYSVQFWSHHTNAVHGEKKFKTNTSESEVEQELTLYLKNPLSPLKSNPLEVWDDMRQVFPNLHKLAQKYLTIVATSVPSERLFSKAGATVCRDRNRLLGKRIGKMLFLGACNEKDWNL